MFRPLFALALAGGLFLNATVAPAAETAQLLERSSGGVTITRQGSENPVTEVFKSTIYGALAGLVVGSAIALAAESRGEPIRWGIVVGTFAGLGAGIYYVAHRPLPASMLELRDGRLVANRGALTAIEPLPGGARVRVLGTHF